MIQRIDNICAVHYTTLDQINSVDLPLGGPAVVETTWQPLDISPGPGLIISRTKPASGEQFESKFTAGLRSAFNLKDLLLIRLTLLDGTEVLIGDTDIPVRVEEDHALKNKTLSFTHLSWHYPYQLTQHEDSSGSSTQGL